MKHLTHTLKVSFTYTTLESQYVHEVQIQDVINIQLKARYMRLKSINILDKNIEQGFEIYINQNLYSLNHKQIHKSLISSIKGPNQISKSF